jgi:hypothetical protein
MAAGGWLILSETKPFTTTGEIEREKNLKRDLFIQLCLIYVKNGIDPFNNRGTIMAEAEWILRESKQFSET